MKVLVTGGAGYIGSHTCVELLNAGHEVVIIDNFVNSKPEALDSIRKITGKDFAFVEADLRDRAAVKALFDAHPVDAVIHFAGLKAVGESVQKPLEYYDNNLGGFFVLAEEMRDHGVKKFVFSSSATVYGMNNPVPFREEMPTSATNPYGYTKVMIEQMLKDIAVADPEWSIVMLRYFNPIGAHPSGLIGEDPNGIPNNLLPYVAQVAAGKLKELTVFGDDYDTPDGTGVRDYIHVVDLALGHLAALNYADSHTGAEAINLGTGHGTSVLEIVRAFEKASGREVPYRIAARRAGDIATCYADTSKAAKLLGWRAERNIDDMCRDGWNFAKNRY
ncbi:MAG TPA: UDP-glucose 4-epimerase GalE [Candidatus Faecivicinus avistercoris]|nr:UDP-glucose 4-epimerase GalE [Candidatus Faecivicinus avistercoris]